MAGDSSNVQELYARVQDGTRQSQRIAALSWNQKLQEASYRSQDDTLLSFSPDISQTERLSAILKERIEKMYGSFSEEDQLYVSAVVQILSFSRVPTLSELSFSDLIKDTRFKDMAPQIKIHIFLALSRLSPRLGPEIPMLDPEVSEKILAEFNSSDSGVRKAAVYAAGLLLGPTDSETQDSRLRAGMRALLSDSAEDVRWNAAFALGRWADDDHALSSLSDILDLAASFDRSGHISGIEGRALTESLLQTFAQAFSMAARFHRSGRFGGVLELHQKLSVIAREHPHLKIRQAALAALESDS